MSESDPTIQTFATYTDARAALDRLLDHDVPTSAVSISARGIRLVEEVHPGGWLHAASEGGLNAALIGLLEGEQHTTERSMRAEHFDLRVAPDHLDRARRILAGVDNESHAAA